MTEVSFIPQQNTEKKWNHGIELLRMLSMFMVCVLHTLNQGGVLSHCSQDGVTNFPQYYMCWVLEIATYCCVDVYALISGYVGYKSKFKPSKILYFLAEVVFYTIIITSYFKFHYPELITEDTWTNAVHPIITGEYWYMTAYLGLLLISPILNAGIQAIDKKYTWTFLGFVLVIFCLFPILLNNTAFNLNSGYSLIWLVILYCLGGLLKKSDTLEKIPFWVGILLYVGMVALTYLLFKKNHSGYVSYRSPTILLSAIGLLIAFHKIRFNNKVVGYIIRLFGEASLGVYLIHVHPLIWTKFVKNFSQKLGMTDDPSVILLLFKILLAGFVIYLVCSLADIVRIYLFRAMDLKKHLEKIDKWYDGLGKRKREKAEEKVAVGVAQNESEHTAEPPADESEKSAENAPNGSESDTSKNQ